MTEEPLAYEEPSTVPDFIKDPVGMLRRRWLWMTAVLVAGLAATGAIVFRIEPSYLATATILVASQRIPEEFVRRSNTFALVLVASKALTAKI